MDVTPLPVRRHVHPARKRNLGWPTACKTMSPPPTNNPSQCETRRRYFLIDIAIWSRYNARRSGVIISGITSGTAVIMGVTDLLLDWRFDSAALLPGALLGRWLDKNSRLLSGAASYRIGR